MFLVMAQMLGHPEFLKEFIMETDACLKGLGAMLSQIGNDNKIMR